MARRFFCDRMFDAEKSVGGLSIARNPYALFTLYKTGTTVKDRPLDLFSQMRYLYPLLG
jgi:hypothetical protein